MGPSCVHTLEALLCGFSTPALGIQMSNSQPATAFNVDLKEPRAHASTLRRFAATLTALGAATTLVFMLTSNNDAPWPIFVPVAFMVLAAFAFHAQSFALQVFARSAFWANLLFALMLCLFGSNRGENYALAFLTFSGTTLLILGRDRLSQSGENVPVAYQGTLLLTLLFAFADIQSLMFWGALFIDEGRHFSKSVTMLLACTSMCVALIGILKLRVWGLALNLGANFVIAAAAMFVWDLPFPVVMLLSSTALIQLFLSTPLWLNLLGIHTRTINVSKRVKALVPIATIVMLMASGFLFFGHFR